MEQWTLPGNLVRSSGLRNMGTLRPEKSVYFTAAPTEGQSPSSLESPTPCLLQSGRTLLWRCLQRASGKHISNWHPTWGKISRHTATDTMGRWVPSPTTVERSKLPFFLLCSQSAPSHGFVEAEVPFWGTKTKTFWLDLLSGVGWNSLKFPV